MQHYFLLLLVMSVTAASGQQLTLDGQIEADAGTETEGIHIYNIFSEKGTLTNAEGAFRIAAAKGDTLLISGVQFGTTSVKITEEHLIRKKIVIRLSSKTTELDEIHLKNHNLSGSLGLEAKTIPTEAHISSVTLGITEKEVIAPTQEVRQLYTAKSGIIDPLVNAISGRTKMLKKRVKLAKNNRILADLLEKFPADFLRQYLELEQEEVYSFLYFCEADPAYGETVTQNDIAILEFLEVKAAQYRQLQKEE